MSAPPAKDPRAQILEHELALERRRIEHQQRTIEALAASLKRLAPSPRVAEIGPARAEAGRDAGSPPSRALAPALGWPSIPTPRAPLPAPPGLAAQSLAGGKARTIAFAVFGLTGEALEDAVRSVADRQRQAMDFVPVFLTDTPDLTPFRRRGYVAEYFQTTPDRSADEAQRAALWRKWQVASLIDIGTVGYLGREAPPTQIPSGVLRQPGKTRVSSTFKPSVKGLERRLWTGFSQSAEFELEKLKRTGSRDEQYASAWALAHWAAARRDFARTIDCITLMRALNPKTMGARHILLLEAECLIQLGSRDDARRILTDGLASRNGFDPELCLAMANSLFGDPQADEVRLRWINSLFTAGGFTALHRKDPSQPLSIDNIHVPDHMTISADDTPTVSIIIPAFNSSKTIRFAVESILAQTWKSLEIIIVDDHSTDDTWLIAEKLADEYDNIVVHRQKRNRGTYVARNVGLQLAKGDLIGTQDADDWSHPQRIGRQVKFLQSNPKVLGCHAYWVRVSNSLEMIGPWRLGSSKIEMNYASLIFRRQVFETLGEWDRVRVGADREFAERCVFAFGPEAIQGVERTVPLTFALRTDRSLTAAADTHARSLSYGVRRDYHEASQWWLGTNPSLDELRFPRPGSSRPFATPQRMLPARAHRPLYDVLFVSDFNMGGGALVAALNEITACAVAGMKVAVFHWRRFDLDVNKPLNSAIWELASRGIVDVISAGDRIVAETIIIEYPAILQHSIDNPPLIDFEHLVVVVSQSANRLRNGDDQAYDPLTARTVLKKTFKSEGTWVPVSSSIGRYMADHGGYPVPYHEPWSPIVDVKAYCSQPLVWRGSDKFLPTIGRHGRDHYSKWPGDALALEQAYCVDKPCSVRVLGGADIAVNMLGRVPANWRVEPFDAVPVEVFLREIDFFVYFPHEDLIEAFGLAVAEAMAAGKPAILAPSLAETFGAAALYSEPSQVWDTVSRLWADGDEYLHYARKGREFVLQHCTPDRFRERLARVKAATADRGPRSVSFN